MLLDYLPRNASDFKYHVLQFNKPKKKDTLAFYVNGYAKGPFVVAKQDSFSVIGIVWILFRTELQKFHIKYQLLQIFIEIIK